MLQGGYAHKKAPDALRRQGTIGVVRNAIAGHTNLCTVVLIVRDQSRDKGSRR